MLRQRLIEQITMDGPMSVADYMAQCLLDPIDGYYTQHAVLGAEGDFVTAPLISQMFGEMIGVWVAQAWLNLGAPAAFRLVEIGGGDGTLMSDILRVADRVQGLRQATQVVMIEPSMRLRTLQAAIPGAAFADSIDALSEDLPLIIIGNEVLDCLPARQYIRIEGELFERVVGLDAEGDLCFGLSPATGDFLPSFDIPDNEIHEYSPAQMRFASSLSDKLKAATGTALLIDYGRSVREGGDTLQALYRHQKHDPLAAPGRHDLTVWADFPLVAATARYADLTVSQITAQNTFLSRLGIEARHAALTAQNPARSDKLHRQFDRLMAPDQMGELFKVIAFAYPRTFELPALDVATVGA